MCVCSVCILTPLKISLVSQLGGQIGGMHSGAVVNKPQLASSVDRDVCGWSFFGITATV